MRVSDNVISKLGYLVLSLSLGFVFFTLNTNDATAQIQINSSGRFVIGATPSTGQLRVNCNNCGNPVRYGIFTYTNGSGQYQNYGIYGNAVGSAYQHIGVRGLASDGTNGNRGVWGSASGSNSYGGYFTDGLYVSGGTTYSSDERLKTNIRSIRDDTSILALINQLTPYHYEYADKDLLRQRGLPESLAEEGEEFGLFAQEVKKISQSSSLM